MSSKKSTIIGIILGLLIGFLMMFIFQLVTPFVEAFFLRDTAPSTPEEYYSNLSVNRYLGAYYVLTWSLTVLGATCSSVLVSRKSLSGLISGGIFYFLFLYNPEMIRANVTVYIIFIIIGAACWLLPLQFIGSKR